MAYDRLISNKYEVLSLLEGQNNRAKKKLEVKVHQLQEETSNPSVVTTSQETMDSYTPPS